MEKITFTVSQADLESFLNRKFTDKQFAGIKEEMEDCLDYYFYDELPRVLAEPEYSE